MIKFKTTRGQIIFWTTLILAVCYTFYVQYIVDEPLKCTPQEMTSGDLDVNFIDESQC